MADCEPLFVEGLRQFVNACAHSNAALPNEAKDAPWAVTMHRLAASAAEAAEIPTQVRLPYGQMRQ